MQPHEKKRTDQKKINFDNFFLVRSFFFPRRTFFFADEKKNRAIFKRYFRGLKIIGNEWRTGSKKKKKKD